MEHDMLWYTILVSVLGLLVIFLVIFLGFHLFHWRYSKHFDEQLVHRFLKESLNWMTGTSSPPNPQALQAIADSVADFRERRNEFWTIAGQVVLSIFLVVVLAVLLLTKTISAEAGLPILSGLSGFAIAKGISAGKRGAFNIPDHRQG